MFGNFFKHSLMTNVGFVALMLLGLGFACSETADEQTKQSETRERSPATLQKTRLVYYAIPG